MRKYRKAKSEEERKKRKRRLQRKWDKKNEKKRKENSRILLRNQRLLVLIHYSNGNLRCECCGETQEIFLVLDHLKGKGTKQRKKIGGGSRFFKWLIKHNFPKGFRVLCYNCNWAFHRLGTCPHQA